jgi:hypothetical protein
MELNELKLAWAEYDKKLSEKLKLNEEILRSIHLEKSADSLRKPARLEKLNFIIAAVVVPIIAFCAINLDDETLYLTASLSCATLCLLSLVMSGIKVSHFNKLFRNEGEIVGYQRDLMHLRQLIMRFRIVEYAIVPLLLMTLLPVLVKVMAGIDLINNLNLFLPMLIISVGISFAFGAWLNLKIYDKGLRDAQKFLDLIDRFEKE